MKKSKLKISDALGAYVRAKFTRAVEHKQGVTTLLRTCTDQLRGIVPCSGEEDVPICMNITAPMVRGVEGLLSNVVVGSSTSRVFVIKPTPDPELSPDDEAALQQRLERAIPDILGGYTDAVLVEKELRNMEAALKTEQVKLSMDRAEKLTIAVHDSLIESNWYDAQSQILRSFCSEPTAIAKYPAVRSVEVLEYQDGLVVPVTKLIKAVEPISPYNFFPSPGATDPQSAEFVIEVRKANKNDLLDYATVPGYDSDGLLYLLEQYPNGHEEDDLTVDAKSLEGNEDENEASDTSINLYDLLGFFGKIPGSYLVQYGVEVEDEQRLYEAELWSCADIVIRATLNPHPLGKRPFYAASFERIEGSFWGECVTSKVAEPQRICTAAVKSAIRNAAFSSGPIGEVDESRVADEDDPTFIEPWVLKLVKPDRNNNSGQPAYRLSYVKNITPELISLYTWGENQAYNMLGLSKAAFGNSEDLGSVGRTSGGVAMILKRADHPIRLSAREFEKRFIEEILQDMVTDLMLYSPDENIKGDVKVYAIGVSGLVEQESKDADLEWALQSVTAMMSITDEQGNPIIPREAPIRLLYELFKSKGIPTDGVFPNFELLDAVNSVTPTSSAPGAAPESPASLLDGRSAAAVSEMSSGVGGPYG
jgi:hypothetical protein